VGERPNRAIVAGLVCLVALAVGVGVGMLRRPQLPPEGVVESGTDVTSATAADGATSGLIEVHVAGAVVSPGVVVVGEGAIVADAIAAAGGMVPGALVSAINLAAPVSGGQQVVVPGASDTATGVALDVVTGTGVLSLSTATPADLETLPGVGPVLAERIVDFREENGPFETVEDLLEVPGIGEAKLASIRDLVVP